MIRAHGKCTRNREEGDRAPEIKHQIMSVYMSLVRDLRLPLASFPAHSLTQEHWLSVQCFLLIILLLPRLSARSKDHSPLSQKPFSICAVPPGLPAEAAPWRATPLSESIKAQLPRADWPRCLAKGGRMLLSLPGSRLLYYGPASSYLCINLIRSNQVQEVRGGRQ